MEVLAQEVNIVIPLGMWYDLETVSKPSLISPFSEKLATALPKFSDYFARSTYMLQGGRRETEIAVIYPIASLQGAFYFESPIISGRVLGVKTIKFLKTYVYGKCTA